MTVVEARTATIALAALGGTISMRVVGGRAVPALDADSIAAALLGTDHGLRCIDVARVGGSEVDFVHLRALTTALHDAITTGAGAAIVTTGTDSIEETAAWLTVTGPWPVPVVVTGSMLPGGEPGGDAAANLRTAVAAAHAAVTTEPVVAFAGKVWLGRQAQKISGTKPDAFATPGRPPLAIVDEQGSLHRAAQPPMPAKPLGPSGDLVVPVPIVTAALGADGALLRMAVCGHPAVVIAGNGAGNLPPLLADAAFELARSGMLVVVASRAADARTGAIYGYPGSGGRLVDGSIVLANGITPHHVRILLTVARSHDDQPESLRTALGSYLDSIACSGHLD